MQTLWKEKNELGSAPFPGSDQIKIVEILFEFQWVGEFSFPRQVVFASVEFHVFVDDSSKAYGVVVYVEDRDSGCSNLLSKARVALCQEGRLTIPKLELTAALVGCHLLNHLNPLVFYL